MTSARSNNLLQLIDPNIEHAIRAIFERLPVPSDKSEKAGSIIKVLAMMAAAPKTSAEITRAFRNSNRVTAEGTLAGIARYSANIAVKLANPSAGIVRDCRQLAKFIGRLQGPAIKALADAPPARFGENWAIIDTYFVRTELVTLLTFPDEVKKLGADCFRLLATAASKTTISDMTDGGRPANGLAHAVGHLLASAYDDFVGPPTIITERQPPIKSHVKIDYAGAPRRVVRKATKMQFVDFVSQIFFAMKIKADPLNVARNAIKDRLHPPQS